MADLIPLIEAADPHCMRAAERIIENLMASVPNDQYRGVLQAYLSYQLRSLQLDEPATDGIRRAVLAIVLYHQQQRCNREPVATGHISRQIARD